MSALLKLLPSRWSSSKRLTEDQRRQICEEGNSVENQELQNEAKSELQKITEELNAMKDLLEERRSTEVFINSRLKAYTEKLEAASKLLDKDEPKEEGIDSGENEENIENGKKNDSRCLEKHADALEKVNASHLELLANIIRLEEKIDILERRRLDLEKVVNDNEKYQLILMQQVDSPIDPVGDHEA